MDAMVTARVPVEIKEQVTALLRENGSTPTELINSAYVYYLEHQKLPQENLLRAGRRRLTKEQAKRIEERVAAMKLGSGKALGGRDFEDVLAEVREGRL